MPLDEDAVSGQYAIGQIENALEKTPHGKRETIAKEISAFAKHLQKTYFSLKEGDTCPHCAKGRVQYITESFPYSTEHWWCENCNSTFKINFTPCGV